MFQSTRIARITLLLAAVLTCRASGRSFAGEPLHDAIGELISAERFKHSHWGILVVDAADGEIVYAHNAGKLFAPASVTKLFSVACALDQLGPDFRFETSLLRRGTLDAGGALDGDLILLASGDLTMGGRTTADGRIAFANNDHTYANWSDDGELTDPDPLGGLNDLARQAAESGVTRVRGDVLVDDRRFDKAEGSGSGPGRLTPIMINDNLVDLVITPAKTGEPATVSLRPQTAAFHLDPQIQTGPPAGELETELRLGADGTLRVTGTIPEGRQPLVRIVEVPDAAAFARTLLIEALRRAGVSVDVNATAPHPPAGELPDRADYEKLPTVAMLVSPPFSESARLILKVSHNLHASTLPLLVAAHHGRRSLDEGLQIQGEFLTRLGIDRDSASFAGAAGGSRADYVTPQATVELLRAMSRHAGFDAYRPALPVLGEDGTLADVVPEGSPARGKVSAKTGTLVWHNAMHDRYHLTSKALAGYLTDASGRELVFAAFVNHVPLEEAADRAEIGRVMGRLCEILHAGR